MLAHGGDRLAGFGGLLDGEGHGWSWQPSASGYAAPLRRGARPHLQQQSRDGDLLVGEAQPMNGLR